MLGGDLVGMTNVPEVTLAREAEFAMLPSVLLRIWLLVYRRSSLSHEEVVQLMDSAN